MKKNPFTVPDGYFDNFTQRMMAEVVKKEKRRKAVRLWKIAASFIVVSSLGITLTMTNTKDSAMTTASTTEQLSGDYINDALDYAMISNSDIEMYLSEAQ